MHKLYLAGDNGVTTIIGYVASNYEFNNYDFTAL